MKAGFDKIYFQKYIFDLMINKLLQLYNWNIINLVIYDKLINRLIFKNLYRINIQI